MELQAFEYYLQTENLKPSTREGELKNVERFIKWVQQNEYTTAGQLHYKEILSYVQHLKQSGILISSVNKHLNSIRKYYEHLKEEGIIETNPAKRLHIKGEVKKVIYNPLKWDELESLYHSYVHYLDTKPLREEKQKQTNLRKKVIAGMLIAQGLHSGELNIVEIQQINLANSTIEITGTRKSNSRELKLDTFQIIPLHEYINTLPATQEKLVVSGAEPLFTIQMHDAVQRITEELKGINQSVQNAQHIRASVILHWLRMYGKRQTQYMTGHKWISSTEHYEAQEIQGLTDMLKKHHPFS